MRTSVWLPSPVHSSQLQDGPSLPLSSHHRQCHSMCALKSYIPGVCPECPLRKPTLLSSMLSSCQNAGISTYICHPINAGASGIAVRTRSQCHREMNPIAHGSWRRTLRRPSMPNRGDALSGCMQLPAPRSGGCRIRCVRSPIASKLPARLTHASHPLRRTLSQSRVFFLAARMRSVRKMVA